MSCVESVLESFVNFKRELSLIAVRGIGGEHKYYPFSVFLDGEEVSKTLRNLSGVSSDLEPVFLL